MYDYISGTQSHHICRMVPNNRYAYVCKTISYGNNLSMGGATFKGMMDTFVILAHGITSRVIQIPSVCIWDHGDHCLTLGNVSPI